MSIAALEIDMYDDANHGLLRKLAMPAALADAPFEKLSAEGIDDLEDQFFGLVYISKHAQIERKFPLNDPGNAWLSAQYFAANHPKLAMPLRFVAAKMIKRACDAYEVPTSQPVEAYARHPAAEKVASNRVVEGDEQRWLHEQLAEQELRQHTKTAAATNAVLEMPDSHFALVLHTGDGETIRKYAMPDAAHVTRAAEYFGKYAQDLEPEHRRRFAESVMNRAGELGVEVRSPALQKWASDEWNPAFEAHIAKRLSLLARPDDEPYRGALRKLASRQDYTPGEMADALATFDKQAGLSRYYDRRDGLVDPYASTMGKVASAWSTEVDGHTITEADLHKVAGKIKSHMGSEIASALTKNAAAVFESLPKPEQLLIKQFCSGEA